MKYLLSDGSSTTNIETYIKDILRLNLMIRLKEVPYWTGGSLNLIYELTDEKLKSEINYILNQIIDRLNIEYMNLVIISVKSISYNNTEVNIGLLINGKLENYGIKRST